MPILCTFDFDKPLEETPRDSLASSNNSDWAPTLTCLSFAVSVVSLATFCFEVDRFVSKSISGSDSEEISVALEDSKLLIHQDNFLSA